MKYLIITILSVFLFTSGNHIAAQDAALKKLEYRLIHLFDSLNNARYEERTAALTETITTTFKNFLGQPGSFSYSFDSLQYAHNLIASDNQVAVLTYPLLQPDRSYAFHGFVQVKTEDGQVKHYELTDRSDSIQEPHKRTLTPEKWYGAFYYKLITRTHNDQTFYTLLGWDGHDLYTNRKVIDVLHINRFGDLVFGAPIIQAPEGMRHRRVFRFSEQAVMTLRYDQRMDMIVYDHLAPPSDFYKDQYQYYGPDFTQDGLEFQDGIWRLNSNIEAKNPRR